MAAAAPKVLASDSLEVTRSSHLLDIQGPSTETKKALSASALLLAARQEKKLARQARGSKNGMDAEAEFDMEDAEDGEMGMAEALREADVGMMDVEEDDAVAEKIKVKAPASKSKSKKQSALRRTGAGSMGMGA